MNTNGKLKGKSQQHKKIKTDNEIKGKEQVAHELGDTHLPSFWLGKPNKPLHVPNNYY